MNLLKQKKGIDSNNITIGGEIEFLILDEKYNEVNEAKKVLHHVRNKGIKVSEECSQSMIELHTPPVHAEDIESILKESTRELYIAGREIGYKVLPFPIVLNQNFMSQMTQKEKYRAKRQVLADERFKVCKKISGIHFHFDMREKEEDVRKQINMLNLLDPLIIALSSASKKQFKNHSIHNTRLKRYRYVAYEKYPFQGNVQGVFQTYEEYEKTLDLNYEKFIHRNKQKGINFSGYCDKYDAIWGPVRINKSLQTVELRTFDSNPDITFVAKLARLVKDSLDKAVDDENIIQRCVDKATSLRDNRPKIALQELSREAIMHGLDSEAVEEYSRIVLKKVGSSEEILDQDRNQRLTSYEEAEKIFLNSVGEGV